MIGRRAASPALRWQGPLRDSLHNARLLTELLQADAPRRVGVLGCHAGAGASTVALNLAGMLAERTDTPVWLLEAELRKPVLAHWLGLKPGGFNRLVQDDTAGWDECAEQGGAGGPKVLTASAVDPALPLLRQAERRLQAPPEGRLVLDLPPLLERPDASLLLPALDGVVLVLDAQDTRWEVAREARQRIEAAGARLIGAVLNKKLQPIPRWLYRLL